jgi:type II secretion system protein J
MRRNGFTLVEAIVAVAILGMVSFMMFRSLLSVLDATQIGAEAADHVQRERVAIKTVEDGLRGMVYYEQNQGMYALTVNPDPDAPSFSFVSRVPPNYLGSRDFKGQTLRRLQFSVEYINDTRALILEQSHVMRAPDGEEAMPVVRSVLAPDLAEFIIHFWSTSTEDWIDEWTETNSLPSRVKVEMALTRQDGGGMQMIDILKREVVIHSVSITKNNQNPDLPAGRAGRPPRRPGGPSGGSSQSSKPRYTPEQIAAYRKRMAERNQGKTDGGSRYTDAQREAYRKRMAEMYKRGQGSGAVNFVPPGGGQQGGGQQSGNQASNAPSASSGTPGAVAINNALMDYEGLNGQQATTVQQLLDQGYLSSIPDPPDGMQWVINSQGNVAYIPL